MKYFEWDKNKNEWLSEERGVCFDDFVNMLEAKEFLDIVDHPNQDRYPNQKMFVVIMNDYAYLIPFVEDKEKFFLKTIIPSRKATKEYLTKKK